MRYATLLAYCPSGVGFMPRPRMNRTGRIEIAKSITKGDHCPTGRDGHCPYGKPYKDRSLRDVITGHAATAAWSLGE